MKEMYKKRYANALRIANMVNGIINTGGMVFNAEGESQCPFEINEEGIFQSLGEGYGKLMYFLDDIELDNGYYTTIKDYNAQFKGWKFAASGDVCKLVVS